MAILGWEVAIAVVLVSFLILGPKKIPELAKAFMRMKREYERGKSGEASDSKLKQD